MKYYEYLHNVLNLIAVSKTRLAGSFSLFVSGRPWLKPTQSNFSISFLEFDPV